MARAYDTRMHGLASHFVWTNRSKESLTLDLKQPEALQVLRDLLGQADVLIQNLAPGATQRMGLGYEWVTESRMLERTPQMAEDAVAKLSAKPVEPGRYDLLLHPSNMWLTIHETVAHPTELDRALGASPAALLAGSNEIDKSYTLTSIGNQEGLDWLEAVPKTKDTAFERIRLGFGKAGLDAMELRDQFGQVTVIRFADIERNPKLASDAFTFVIPKGADLIRE